MRLFIAEKPSVAKVIIEELGKVKSCKGYCECKNDQIVTWCFGHMYELAEPDEYLSNDVPVRKNGKKMWRFEELPIVPSLWKLKARSDVREQLKTIKELIKKAQSIVNAGDPDREGQLLVDEILDQCSCNVPVLRYWANAQDHSSVAYALDHLTNNSQYQGMKHAAMARARADWLVGMNLTRAFTLAANNTLITIGRVQSPTLKLVVDRDYKIENFKPIDYYNIVAEFETNNGKRYQGNLITKNFAQGITDEESRIIDQNFVNQFLSMQATKVATIKSVVTEDKRNAQPLGLSLSDIQSKASSLFGYGAEEVLNLCQSLYEKKVTTYPRTDCSYLPTAQRQDASKVLNAISIALPELKPFITNANINITSNIWNDEKTTAHHAIVPTQQPIKAQDLSVKELNIYKLVCKYFIAQFYPTFDYSQTKIITQFNSYEYESIGRTINNQGWRTVINEEESKNKEILLPMVRPNEQVKNLDLKSHKEQTKAPSRFTEGSLIKAMENIYLYVDDPQAKKMLKDGDGIGTSATRANIIEELKKRGYIEKKGKNIISTQLGRQMIGLIPDKIKSPILTSLFESILKKIESGNAQIDDFINNQVDVIKLEISKVKATKINITDPHSSSLYKCTQCSSPLKRLKNSKGSMFWLCSNCNKTFSDLKGKPDFNPTTVEISTVYKCKACGAGLRRLESKKKKGIFFWSCSNYPTCKEIYFDDQGVPNYGRRNAN